MNLKALLTSLFTAVFFTQSAAANTPEPKVYWEEGSKGQITFFADNPEVIPQWVEVEFSELKNMTPSQPGPFIFTVKAKSKKAELFHLKPAKNRGYNFKTATRILPGKGPDTRHQDNHLYLLPFAHGKKYQLGQSYFGTATHTQPNPYALDFNMDTGSMICAARDGVVVDVKQDSNIGGPSPRFAKHGNHVTIYHDDGTFANYAHLKKRGALVKKGQRVKAGQNIGLSGNTGQSSGPHLHFEVFKYNPKGESRNLPVRFINHDNKPLADLNTGIFYYATHPTKPKYTVKLGATIKDSDFTQSVKLPYSDKFDITTKIVDHSIALFASNGKKSTMDFELSLNLTNYTSSQSSPIVASVPPLTEQFLLILKPIDVSKPGKYGYSIKQQLIGQAINDAKYDRYSKPVRQTDEIKINQKNKDEKVLLFASNGFNRTISLEIRLKLQNMTASKGLKQKISIPPLTEVYLQHVTPIKTTKDSQLGYSIRFR
ncbi:MAG: M23 family metallopeptidase [Algicola sp.]|nr:M23 family metallopeptidase [Algicola sp.]